VTPRSGLVYAPARPPKTGGRKDALDALFELRRGENGQPVLPVYSSVDGLVQALGHYQPWVCVPLAQVVTALAGQARVAVDPPADPGAWRWSKVALAMSGQDWNAGLPGTTGPEGTCDA
jgi:hypothetical protein